MKVLITGAGGQLGQALQQTAPHHAPQGCKVVALSRAQFDLLDQTQTTTTIARERPDLIINAAAYTAVDRAETEQRLAKAVNATAPGTLAAAAQRAGARFIHLSTDFVFDGESSRPYTPEDTPSPLGAYGRTKLEGERAVLHEKPDALILRTAWVYAAGGHNFVRTMLRLMRERDEVRVVADQLGTPTHAASLARAIWRLTEASGIWHWTDAGVASWYDFAVAIGEEALALGLLDRPVSVVPIATKDYPVPAKRPAMGILDKSKSWARIGVANHWRTELRIMLAEMKGTK